MSSVPRQLACGLGRTPTPSPHFPRNLAISMLLRELRLQNYRTFEHLHWYPGTGLNALIGPGDAGKSTILAAVDLLLSPAPVGGCFEFDFHNRRLEEGFEIRGVLTGGDLSGAFEGTIPPLWGWRDGELRELLDEPGGDAPAVVCRVSGTPDLELEYALLEPSGETRSFGVGLRRRIYAGQLGAAADPARELRATQGTLLTRHLGRTEGLRAALTRALKHASAHLSLTEDLQVAVSTLGQTLGSRYLAGEVSLGLVAQRGGNLLGLATLMQGEGDNALPLNLAGSGTTRLTLLALAAELAGESPILSVDELEQGLEPYRQRQAVGLMSEVAGTDGQALLTTHATPVLAAVSAKGGDAPVIHRVTGERVVPIEGPRVLQLLRDDPEAFFARLPIVCEGQTECGFLLHWLPARWGRNLEDFGVHLINGRDLGGNRASIDRANALLDLDFDVAAFLDNEHTDPGRRAALRQRCPVFEWTGDGIRNIEEATAKWLPLDRAPALFAAASEVKDVAGTNLVAEVWEAAGGQDSKPAEVTDLVQALGSADFRSALAQALQSRRGWFKGVAGGQRLAEVLTYGGLPAPMAEQLQPFADAVRRHLG